MKYQTNCKQKPQTKNCLNSQITVTLYVQFFIQNFPNTSNSKKKKKNQKLTKQKITNFSLIIFYTKLSQYLQFKKYQKLTNKLHQFFINNFLCQTVPKSSFSIPVLRESIQVPLSTLKRF